MQIIPGVYFKRKFELKDVMMCILQDVKVMYGAFVRYIHCNKGGENEAFSWLCKQEWMSVKLKYIAPNTTQKNG